MPSQVGRCATADLVFWHMDFNSVFAQHPDGSVQGPGIHMSEKAAGKKDDLACAGNMGRGGYGFRVGESAFFRADIRNASARILADHPNLFSSDDIGGLNPLGAGIQTGHTLEAGMNGFLVPVSRGKLPCGHGPYQIQPPPGGKGFYPFLPVDRTSRKTAAASLTLDVMDKIIC